MGSTPIKITHPANRMETGCTAKGRILHVLGPTEKGPIPQSDAAALPECVRGHRQYEGSWIMPLRMGLKHIAAPCLASVARPDLNQICRPVTGPIRHKQMPGTPSNLLAHARSPSSPWPPRVCCAARDVARRLSDPTARPAQVNPQLEKRHPTTQAPLGPLRLLQPSATGLEQTGQGGPSSRPRQSAISRRQSGQR